MKLENLISIYDLACNGYEGGRSTDGAICRATEDYIQGIVPNQSKTFRPTTAEFADRVRFQDTLASVRDRPRLPPPVYDRTSIGGTPWDVKVQAARARYAGWTVFMEDQTLDNFRHLSAGGKLPVGATWVPMLNGDIMAPPLSGEDNVRSKLTQHDAQRQTVPGAGGGARDTMVEEDRRTPF